MDSILKIGVAIGIAVLADPIAVGTHATGLDWSKPATATRDLTTSAAVATALCAMTALLNAVLVVLAAVITVRLGTDGVELPADPCVLVAILVTVVLIASEEGIGANVFNVVGLAAIG